MSQILRFHNFTKYMIISKQIRGKRNLTLQFNARFPNNNNNTFSVEIHPAKFRIGAYVPEKPERKIMPKRDIQEIKLFIRRAQK